MPIGSDCESEACPVSPHASTGFCLAATGAPVLVVTTLPCPPGDPTSDIVVTLIDPATGLVVAPQPIVSCGDRDWEVNQLCDYDTETGDFIATFIQVFEWDTDTGVLTISNVRADDPTVPYTPTGTVRACSDDETQADVEITEFCYDPAGPETLARGFHAWLFINGEHTGDVYYDAAGGILLSAPAFLPCPDLVYLGEISTNTGTTAAATHLEDAPAVSGDRGVLALGVRNDTNATRTDTDGDYSALATDAAARAKINVDVEVAAAFTHGQNTDIDSGADEQIVVASNPAAHGVVVKAMPANTGILYIGIVGVTSTTGFPLEAGENITIPVDNANKIYARASVDNQALAWVAV